ncbi:peptidoglycan DD-metalloendopeptidase family protein [Microbacterium sp. NPDC087592]|uniref:M23 family metallopeptidase n=1 Tax=Microbacterium sp. NPDC087592 TaxID=3364193 RepID=UPI003803ED3E
MTLTGSPTKLQIGNGGIRGDRPPRTSALRKDSVTNSLPPERAHDAPEAPEEAPVAPRPLLRRDRRNSAPTTPEAPRAADAPSNAQPPRTADASTATQSPVDASTATATATATETQSPVDASTATDAQSPVDASTPTDTQSPVGASTATTDTPRPSHPKATGTPGRPRSPRGRLARKPASSPVRPRRAKRPWAKAKALGATFAIGVMVTGAALPALATGSEGVVAGATTSLTTAAAADAAQSYTSTSASSSSDEIRAEIAPRGTFSATTPEEIEETRSRAVAAALAAGMPLGSAVDIPIADRIIMPMADGTYSFTDGFGASRPGRSHLGQDFAAGVGTPINAAMKGCVSRSTESYQGYGVTIQIESIVDGQAVSTVYSHLNYGTRAVEVGDCVDEGQYLGDVGSTGYVFGSCLHFEVHINTVAIDPMPWLQTHVN